MDGKLVLCIKAFKHGIPFLLPFRSIIILNNVRAMAEFIAIICKSLPAMMSKAVLHIRNELHVEVLRM